MNYEGSFDDKGSITWAEAKRKPADLRRLQGVMFIDRIDLWRAAPRRRKPGSTPLPGQASLIPEKEKAN